jgi:hypothetical protein
VGEPQPRLDFIPIFWGTWNLAEAYSTSIGIQNY